MYSIYVSGTTENSIMTNYSFFLRTPKDEYEIVEKDDRPVTIKLMDDKEHSIRSERNISVTQSKISAGSVNNRIGLGYP